LVQEHNRFYSPRLGQFISHDPLGYIDSYNPYQHG
jgi:RHS repeat-associated protein